jgi:hypothetical protein
MLWHGHPGRVIDLGQYPNEVAISFVNGPSLCLSPDQVERLDDATYRERGERVLALRHPADAARPIPQFWADLVPWADDEVLGRD